MRQEDNDYETSCDNMEPIPYEVPVSTLDRSLESQVAESFFTAPIEYEYATRGPNEETVSLKFGIIFVGVLYIYATHKVSKHTTYYVIVKLIKALTGSVGIVMLVVSSKCSSRTSAAGQNTTSP